MLEKIISEMPESEKMNVRDQGKSWADQPGKGLAWPPTPDRAPKTLGRLAPKDVPTFAAGVAEFLRHQREAEWMAILNYAEDTIRKGEQLLESGKETWPAVWEVIDTRAPASADERREERGALTRKLVAPPGGNILRDVESARATIKRGPLPPSRVETAWTQLAETATKSE